MYGLEAVSYTHLDVYKRQELIRSTQHDGLVEYQDEFIRIIRDSLVDSAPGVREAAAQTFEALQEELGKVVIDEILPHLLTMLESDDSQPALLALQDIMATKSDVIFPILIPSLLSPPIDAFKANALSSLASVAGSALYKRLSLIINTLVNAVIDSKAGPEETQNEIKESFDKILLSIDDDEGVHTLMQQLLALVKHEDAAKRAVIYERLGNFFTHTNLDYSVYLVDMISQFILSLGDKSPEVVQGTFDALSALVKSCLLYTSESFLKLSELVSPRLGQLKSFVGVATLRINNVEGLPSNYKDEPLLNLVGRLLFRIKILADQNPLDSISLSYILPLLTKVLQIGKQVAIKNSTKQAVTSEFVNEDQEEEQLLLAIEIIAAHSEAFEDDSIPRDRILEVLLSLMRLPSKSKIAKDCFLSMGQHIACLLYTSRCV